MAEKTYYTGEGVFHFDGKDYGFGKELPAAVPAESIEALLKKNKASRKAPEKGDAVAADESTALRGQVQTLKAQLGVVTEQRDAAERAASEGSVEIGRLQGVVTEQRDAAERAAGDGSVEIGRLQGLVAEQAEQIAALTAAATPATLVPPPPGGAAGPKK